MAIKNIHIKKIEFPFREAIYISYEHIKKRRKRSLILAFSVALGISLLTHLEMSNIIFAAHNVVAAITLEAYQYWLIIISLIVVGVGLINANLIAISERYREIGTMKCLGALDQHVMKLFLVESVIIGLVGGISGFLFGTITATFSSSIQLGIITLMIIPLFSTLQFLGFTMLLSLIISIVSTTYPALRAARLNPVEALGYHI